MKRLPALVLLAVLFVAGCGKSDAGVSATEEKAYRNPQRTMPAGAAPGKAGALPAPPAPGAR